MLKAMEPKTGDRRRGAEGREPKEGGGDAAMLNLNAEKLPEFEPKI